MKGKTKAVQAQQQSKSPGHSATPVNSVSPRPDTKDTPAKVKESSLNRFKSFSIKAAASGDLKSEKQIDEKISVDVNSTDLRNKVSNKDLVNAWLEFSKAHKENKVLLSQIMDEHKPVLQEDGETYQIIVFNEFQEKKIQENALGIADHLRTQVKNSFIKMKVTVDETKDEKQFFTSTDKLKLMVEINPDLNLLRKAFDLDLE